MNGKCFRSSCGLPGFHLQCHQLFIETLVTAIFIHSLEYILYIYKHKILPLNIALYYVHRVKLSLLC